MNQQARESVAYLCLGLGIFQFALALTGCTKDSPVGPTPDPPAETVKQVSTSIVGSWGDPLHGPQLVIDKTFAWKGYDGFQIWTCQMGVITQDSTVGSRYYLTIKDSITTSRSILYHAAVITLQDNVIIASFGPTWSVDNGVRADLGDSWTFLNGIYVRATPLAKP